MSYCESDMSFSSDISSESNEYHHSDSELSEDELMEFERSKKKLQNPEHREEIIKDVQSSINNKMNNLDVGISYSGIRTLALFNHTTDLAHWVSKQNSINDFESWLSVPRSSRLPYTPFTMLGGYGSLKGVTFNYKSLLIKNLSTKTTGFQLREIFSRYGFVRDVYIPVNHTTGEKCNYAFIEIHPIVDIEKIIKDMSQFSVLNGRSMQVQIAISGRRSATEMKERYTTTAHYSTHRYYQTAERFRSL
jgi:hypothetical protein